MCVFSHDLSPPLHAHVSTSYSIAIRIPKPLAIQAVNDALTYVFEDCVFLLSSLTSLSSLSLHFHSSHTAALLRQGLVGHTVKRLDSSQCNEKTLEVLSRRVI